MLLHDYMIVILCTISYLYATPTVSDASFPSYLIAIIVIIASVIIGIIIIIASILVSLNL